MFVSSLDKEAGNSLGPLNCVGQVYAIKSFCCCHQTIHINCLSETRDDEYFRNTILKSSNPIKYDLLNMMTFLVFDLDVLFIPCFFFFLSAAAVALPYLKNYP